VEVVAHKNVCHDLVKATFKFVPAPMNLCVPLSMLLYQYPSHISHPSTQQVKTADEEQTSNGPDGEGTSLQGESTATDTLVLDVAEKKTRKRTVNISTILWPKNK